MSRNHGVRADRERLLGPAPGLGHRDDADHRAVPGVPDRTAAEALLHVRGQVVRPGELPSAFACGAAELRLDPDSARRGAGEPHDADLVVPGGPGLDHRQRTGAVGGGRQAQKRHVPRPVPPRSAPPRAVRFGPATRGSSGRSSVTGVPASTSCASDAPKAYATTWAQVRTTSGATRKPAPMGSASSPLIRTTDKTSASSGLCGSAPVTWPPLHHKPPTAPFSRAGHCRPLSRAGHSCSM
ncbi:hypothetical protein QFZ82_000672 [Streptomyces sp. V4I23]|nr:hypothetical protein [Streptomyces sp. V4I23]